MTSHEGDAHFLPKNGRCYSGSIDQQQLIFCKGFATKQANDAKRRQAERKTFRTVVFCLLSAPFNLFQTVKCFSLFKSNFANSNHFCRQYTNIYNTK
jgi:hypothetical protein